MAWEKALMDGAGEGRAEGDGAMGARGSVRRDGIGLGIDRDPAGAGVGAGVPGEEIEVGGIELTMICSPRVMGMVDSVALEEMSGKSFGG
jgi:hypothetical protein